MKRLPALVVGSALLAGSLTLAAPPASAATVWDFSSGSFTLSDGLPPGQESTATVEVSNLRSTGSSVSGRVTLRNARYSCSGTFSGLTADFSNPCNGSVTFSIDAAGVLTVSGSSVYIPTTLLTGPGTGSVQGIGPTVTSCTVTVMGDSADVQWVAQGSGITEFSVGVVNGQNPNVDVLGGAGPGIAQISLVGENPGPLEIAVEVNGDSALIFPCGQLNYVPVPGKPAIDSLVPAADGLLTVNDSVAAPTTVQGIEYEIDGGTWTRPGGQAPVNGAGGAFTLSGLSAGQHTVTLRSVGLDSVVTTEGDPQSARVPSGGGDKPSGTSTGIAIGSSPSKPVPAPPVVPVSTVSGTGNGAGTGTNGALAANTGDAGIDAPCLAEDGTLYPNQYSTVGSQLTMAPNTRGMGTVLSFTVVDGALAPGMQLDRTFGVLFGVTTQAGSWVTTIKAKLADGSTKTSQFTTRVDADPQTLQYAAQNIGSVGTRIAIAPTTSAPGTGTTYELVCGKLPAGTTFDTRTGLIAGKPTTTVALPTPLRVAETNATGKAAASFIFVVNARGTTSISYPAHPHLRVGKRVAIRPTVAGVGDIALFRMWKGKLPKGLRLSKATGVISGKIARRGAAHTITIVAVTKGGALLTASPIRLTLQR